MGTKGTWQRPGDARAWDDNYSRIFRQKATTMPIKTMTKAEAKAIVKTFKVAHRALDRLYVTKIEGAACEELDKLVLAGLDVTVMDLRALLADVQVSLGSAG